MVCDNSEVGFHKLNEDVTIPMYSTDESIGMDVRYFGADTILKHGEFKLFTTGLTCELPSNCYLRIAPRSGLAVKGVDVLAGVIDPDYKGEIKVILINHGPDIEIKNNDRIAQLILESAKRAAVVREYAKDSNSNDIVHNTVKSTIRGTGGFGSTGMQ